MNLSNPNAEIYIPDQLSPSEATDRTTHLCIAAHQDDIEIMAAQPIIECFTQKDQWFTGIVLTDGRGSPRNGFYQHISDEEMRSIRMQEQRKAAFIGNYAALIFLDYPSSEIKDAPNKNPVEDIVQILRATKPKNIYTHNLADKHDTHVAVALRVIQAVHLLKPEERPEKVFGCEVWRSLDWVNDPEKVVMDLSSHEHLQHALLAVYDSQIAGGKRYDLAAMSRRYTNATFLESHGVDVMTRASFAMDLTPLVNDPGIMPLNYINGFIDRFALDVMDRISRLS
jgi:LmbE family N-acetylglucosaminyl deacetylase